MSPPDDAEEVLVLTHACDLPFVEAACVRPARAAGARVTVVHAAGRAVGGTTLHGAYVPVPVLCRSGGAFQPKLVVAVSARDALVSIGSGDATAAGWHHDAEVWTHLRADGDTVPALFADLAGWLRRLPGLLWIDPLGAQRLHAVADLLVARPVAAAPDEPLLLVNDEVPIVAQLPFPGGANLLSVAAPAFDAESALVDGVRPAEVRRYHQGRVIEWWTGGTGVVVTGSAACTRPALLLTATEPGGNCELALLQDATESLLGAAGPPAGAADPGDRTGDDPAPAGPQVLGVRLWPERIEVTVHGSAVDPPAAAVLELAGESYTLPRTGGAGPVSGYTLDGGDFPTDVRTAELRVGDGAPLGSVPVTDVTAALRRIAHPSPLERLDLADVVCDEGELDALFQALGALGVLGVPGAPAGTAGGRRAREEGIRAAVGPALLDLALGRTAPDSVDTAVALLEEPARERLRLQLVRLVAVAAGWPLPARLAAFRVVLVLAAAGLWPQPRDWTPVVAAGLDALLAAEDGAFAGEQAALATVGLVAVGHGHRAEPFAGFEDVRAAYRLGVAADELVERYAAALGGPAFGARFGAADVRAAAGELLSRSAVEEAFDEAVDAIPESAGTVRRAGDGVHVDTAKDPRKTALLVLDLLRDFPDTHVTVRGSAGTDTHGWWNGRRLVLLSPYGGRWRAALWPGLMTGIAAYAKGSPLPAPARSWVTDKVEPPADDA